MAKAEPASTLSLAQARRLALAAQGLHASASGEIATSVEATGFVRTLGGADVYLAVRARRPGTSRADLDRAVESSKLQVVPAARGCIYLVPRRDVSTALRFADLRTRTRTAREHERAGIRAGELEDVGQAILEALVTRGASTTSALRRSLPDDAIRSLGADGKKVGLSSTLPPALRQLEFTGAIERTLDKGRLDTERYLWRIPEENPFEASSVAEDPAELNARMATIFFRAAGLATVNEFATWAGITQRDAKAALEHLSLLSVQIEGRQGTYLALDDQRGLIDDAVSAELPAAAALLPFEDNLVALHGGPALMVDPAYHDLEVKVWGRGKGSTLGDVRHSSMRTLVAGDGIAGFWEFNPDAEEVELGYFQSIDAEVKARLETLAGETSRFLAEEIGHGHSFSLDTDDSLRKRLALVQRYQS